MAQQQAPDPRRPDSAVMAPPPIASAPEAAAGAARGSGRQEHMTHRVVARSPPELPTALGGLTLAYAEAFREAPWHETPAQIAASVRGCAPTRTSRGSGWSSRSTRGIRAIAAFAYGVTARHDLPVVGCRRPERQVPTGRRAQRSGSCAPARSHR